MFVTFAIIILLIPITYLAGGAYKSWLWGLLPPHWKVATYSEGLLFPLALITVLVAVFLFHKHRSRLARIRSDLAVLLLFWILAMFALMNPFVIAGLDSILWQLRK